MSHLCKDVARLEKLAEEQNEALFGFIEEALDGVEGVSVNSGLPGGLVHIFESSNSKLIAEIHPVKRIFEPYEKHMTEENAGLYSTIIDKLSSAGYTKVDDIQAIIQRPDGLLNCTEA